MKTKDHAFLVAEATVLPKEVINGARPGNHADAGGVKVLPFRGLNRLKFRTHRRLSVALGQGNATLPIYKNLNCIATACGGKLMNRLKSFVLTSTNDEGIRA